MSDSYIFTGIGFSVQSAIYMSPGVLRVSFTVDPLKVSASNSNDGLNPSNYFLSGPGEWVISSIQPVIAEPQSVEILFSAPLAQGNWVVTVSNVESVDGDTLGSGQTLNFSVSELQLTNVNLGAEQETPEFVIRKHFLSTFKGPNWDAVIAALAVGDDFNWENAKLAQSQLHLSSASGLYLDKRAAEIGVRRPDSMGLIDEIFRKYAIKSNKKLVLQSLLEILEVFYGQDSLRAYVETDLEEPFYLQDGMTLDFVLNGNLAVKHVFKSEDFSQISQAKAIEIAVGITSTLRNLGYDGFATASVNPVSGAPKVRIYSGALGLGSSVQVTGGDSQRFLQFPSYEDVYSGTITSANAYDWVYVLNDNGFTELSLTTSNPLINIETIESGDYVVIGTDAQSAPGVYSISEVVRYRTTGSTFYQKLTLTSDIGFTGTARQLSNDAYLFFSPTKRTTISNGSRNVLVSKTTPHQVDVTLPATTAAIKRTFFEASYGKLNAAQDIQTLRRSNDGTITIVTKDAHSLSVGQQVEIQNFVPASSVPYTYPADNSNNLTSASLVSTFGTTSTDGTFAAYPSVITLTDGSLLITGGMDYQSAFTPDGETDVCHRLSAAVDSVLTETEAAGATIYETTWGSPDLMPQASQGHQLSLMTDGAHLGFVFCTGGFLNDTQTILDTACYYDPDTDNWTSVATMGTARKSHQQAVLPDGRIMVIGGATSDSTATASCEIYDPSLDTWTSVANMSQARAGHRAILLDDETVLVTGGRNPVDDFSSSEGWPVPADYGTAIATCELYDIATNTWTNTGAMSFGRSDFAITKLDSGLVLVACGVGYRVTQGLPNGLIQYAETYDPTTGRWSYAGVTGTKILSDFVNVRGELLLIGAMGDSDYRIDRFDPNTMTWKKSHLSAPQYSVAGVFNTDSDLVGIITNVDSTDEASMENIVTYSPASNIITNGGVNGIFTVLTSDIGNKTFTIATPDYPGYTSNYGSPLGGDYEINYDTEMTYTPVAERNYTITTAQRTSNVTTITLGAPVSSNNPHNLQIGQVIFCDFPTTSTLAPGLRTITAVTPTTVSYAETGSDVGSTAVSGIISTDHSDEMNFTEFKAVANSEAVGPYILDTESGYGLLNIPGVTLNQDILAGQTLTKLTLNSTASIPESGFIVLNFGQSNQSVLIEYLYIISSTEIAIKTNTFSFNHAMGEEVSFMDGREIFSPEDPSEWGLFYVTGSTAGRTFAIDALNKAMAAGVDLDLTIVYPSDRGLGAEGYPAEGAIKLSDKVEVWAYDDVDEEIKEAQEGI